jgi:hypothetical protein
MELFDTVLVATMELFDTVLIATMELFGTVLIATMEQPLNFTFTCVFANAT